MRLLIALLMLPLAFSPGAAAPMQPDPLDGFDERVPHDADGYQAWTPWMKVQSETVSTNVGV